MAGSLASLMVRVLADTSQFVRSMDHADAAVTQMATKTMASGRRMSAVGASLTRGLTLPLGFMAYKAVNAAADFEKSMNLMAVVTDSPAAKMQQLDALAKKMGADTVFSAQEAADAMVNLAKGGLSVAQIEAGGLAANLALASAADMELAESANIMSAAMNTFKLPGTEATRVADALAGAANASSADLGDLSYALRAGGSSAARFGMSVEETAGLLALLADNGIKGSDAGTLLKSQLRTLVPTTKKAQSAMADLGLDFFDAQGSFIGVSEMAQELQDELGYLTQEQRELAMAQIFGSDASRLTGILARDGASALVEYTEAASDAGVAAETANAKMEGLPGSLEQMRGSLETAALAAGDALAPAVMVLADGITGLANAFTVLPGPARTLIVTVAALAAGIGPVLWVVGKLKVGLVTLVGPFKAVTAATKAYAAAAALSGNNVKGFKAVLGGIQGALASNSAIWAKGSTLVSQFVASAGGVGPALGAAIPVAAAAAVAVTTWTMAIQEANKTHQIQQELMKSSIPFLDAYAEGVSKGYRSVKELEAAIKNEIDWMIEEGANQQELNAVRTHGAQLLKQYADAEKVVIKRGGEMVTMTKEAVLAAQTFNGMTRKEYDEWRGGTVQNFNKVIGAVGRLAEKNKVTAAQIVNSMRKSLRAQVDFGKNWTAVVDRAGKQGESFVAWIQENYGAKAPAFVAALKNANRKEFAEIVSIWKKSERNAETTSSATGKAFDKIPKGAREAKTQTKQEISAIPSIISGVAGPARSAGESVGSAIKGGVASGLSGIKDQVSSEVAGAVRDGIEAGKAAGKIRSPSKLMEEVGANLMKGLLVGIQDYESAVIKQMGKVDGYIDIGNHSPEIESSFSSAADSITRRGGTGSDEDGDAKVVKLEPHFHTRGKADKKFARDSIDEMSWLARTEPFSGG